MPAWRPLLTGDAAEAARAAIHDIADGLAALDAGAIGNPSLAGGHAGIALLYAYLDRQWPERGYHEHALRAVECSLEQIEDVLSFIGLFSGFTGIAWTAAHLECAVWQSHEVDDLQPLDEILHEVLQLDWQSDYDLISGLVGLGLYALERPDSAVMNACLERVLAHLEERAERDARGATWKTPAEHLPAHQRAVAPDGYYNLGLAHGVPGVIAFLAKACARTDTHARARELLRDTMRWYVAQLLPPDCASATRTWLGPNPEHHGPESRAAWCYGDPGAAIALLQGARALGDADMLECALAVGRRAARRPADTCGIKDAAFCHGAVGLGHVFNRMYQATGDRDFATAAQTWFQRALDMRVPGHGLAGYLSLESVTIEGPVEWRSSPGLLTGVAGIALAFSAAVGDIEPAWDRHLLCAVDLE